MAKVQVDWHGSFAVNVTTFGANGEIDDAGCRQVFSDTIEAGCHGVIAPGSTGEFFLMNDVERARVFALAVEAAAGRVPVLACPAATRTEDVLAHTRAAQRAGCDGVMVLPPIYVGVDDNEVVEFYTRIADASSLPVMLYNSPFMVKKELTTDLVHQLSEHDNIVAIKDSSFDIRKSSDLMRACGDAMKVFIGVEDMYLPALSIGAAGAVAMAPQIVGRPAPEIYDAFVAGDLERARRCHYLVARIYDILFQVGSMYVAVKEAMNLLGKPGGHMRAPMLPFTDEQRSVVAAILRETGFLAAEAAE